MHVVLFEIKNYKLCKVPKKKMERSWFGWISEWRMRRLLTHFIFDVVFAFHQSFMFPLLFRFFCLETWSDLLVGIINRFLIFPCSCMDLGISCGGILTDAFWVQACTILNIQPLVSTEVALLWDCSCCQMVNDLVPSCWPHSCPFLPFCIAGTVWGGEGGPGLRTGNFGGRSWSWWSRTSQASGNSWRSRWARWGGRLLKRGAVLPPPQERKPALPAPLPAHRQVSRPPPFSLPMNAWVLMVFLLRLPYNKLQVL